MSWTQADKDTAEKFLKDVVDEDCKILFEPSICDVHVLPLEFYDGYELVRIANKYTIPYMQLDYLSNGENHYYLDGSEGAFHNLNARGAISLDKKNAFDYLNLYISYVYERGNSLGFRGEYETSTVEKNETTGNYDIVTPLTYQDEGVQGEIEVTPKGVIHVKKPLQVTFLDNLNPSSGLSYTHPHESKIIEESRGLLGGTETGQKLLSLATEKKPGIKIISSPNYQGFCSNTRTIYMTMPAEEQTGKYLQALLLAGCIRDMQQVHDGYMHPHPVEDEETYGDVNLGKNLDMVIEMCKIVEELEAQNIPEGLHDLSKMGFGGLYQAYKTGSGNEALMELYLTTLEEKKIIQR